MTIDKIENVIDDGLKVDVDKVRLVRRLLGFYGHTDNDDLKICQRRLEDYCHENDMRECEVLPDDCIFPHHKENTLIAPKSYSGHKLVVVTDRYVEFSDEDRNSVAIFNKLLKILKTLQKRGSYGNVTTIAIYNPDLNIEWSVQCV